MNEYGDVVNGPETFATIAAHLNHNGRAMIGWSDGMGTKFEILFTLCVPYAGTISGGIRPFEDLFVSIIGKGAAAFTTPHSNELDTGYIEGQYMVNMGETAGPFADLVNGVRALIV